MIETVAYAELPPPSRARVWWEAARPKTLTASLAPVLVGTALAFADGAGHFGYACLALVGALLIQVGTNFANDVLDFRRGADTDERLGQPRAVQSGWVAPRTMAVAAGVTFAAALVVGVALVARGGWPILVLGLAAVASGVLYTAGPRPLAYVGLADLFVLLFFGLAAVAGTYYVQALTVTVPALVLGLAEGCHALAILTVNNLRDRVTDEAAGKRTLAVRMGDRNTRRYIALALVAAYVLPVVLLVLGWLRPPVLLSLAAVPVGWLAFRPVRGGATGRALNPVLGATARQQMVHALLLAAGVLVPWA